MPSGPATQCGAHLTGLYPIVEIPLLHYIQAAEIPPEIRSSIDFEAAAFGDAWPRNRTAFRSDASHLPSRLARLRLLWSRDGRGHRGAERRTRGRALG